MLTGPWHAQTEVLQAETVCGHQKEEEKKMILCLSVWNYLYCPVSEPNIQCCKLLWVAEITKDLIYVGHWICTLYCNLIEILEVYAKSYCPSFIQSKSLGESQGDYDGSIIPSTSVLSRSPW